MERDKNELKTNGRLSEILRCVLYAVVVVFLVLCNTFLFLEHRHTKQRLTALEDKMITEETLKKFFAASQMNSAGKDKRLDTKALLVRERRAQASSIESLEKRVKVLEFRALRENKSFPREESRTSESCKGRDGRDGRDGPVGPPGSPGIPGNPGTTGVPGTPGTTGMPGTPGTTGMPGTPGTPGRDGRDGRKGFVGARGMPGPKGDIGVSGKAGIEGPSGPKGEKGQEGKGLCGVKYVRWGRTSCGGDAQVVYTGFIAGGRHNNPGGGSNYLCLPNEPKYGKYTDRFEHTGAIYGAEYEVNSFNPFKRNVHDHDAPCVVCYVRSRGTQLMIPARDDCPIGWTEEYHGYLMAEHWDHKKPQNFICVDWDAESVPGSQSSHDGALLYLVQANCGFFSKCPPYYEGRELTCAVCTK